MTKRVRNCWSEEQNAREAVKKVDLSCDSCELFRIAKWLERRKVFLGLVVLIMKVGQGR